MGQDLLLTLSILLSVPGRVKFGECCTGSASEAEEEVDALAVVVAEKHFETAAARSFMELVLGGEELWFGRTTINMAQQSVCSQCPHQTIKI